MLKQEGEELTAARITYESIGLRYSSTEKGSDEWLYWHTKLQEAKERYEKAAENDLYTCQKWQTLKTHHDAIRAMGLV